MEEILETEKSYMEHLVCMRKYFMIPMKEASTVSNNVCISIYETYL